MIMMDEIREKLIVDLRFTIPSGLDLLGNGVVDGFACQCLR